MIGLARGGAFVALAAAPQPDDGARLAAALERAARARPPSAPALPALAIRHVVAVPAPGAFRAALASLADAPVALTTPAPARIPAAPPPRPAPVAPPAPVVAAPTTLPRATNALRASPAPLSYDPERLELLWTGGGDSPVLLVRPPAIRSGNAAATDVDTSTTGVFIDAPSGVDMRYLDLVFRDAAEFARPAALLLSVAAVSVTDRSFRGALRRLAEPLAARGHTLNLLVSARYADEQPARLTALRDEGWRVGLHLFAGGRLQVRTLAAARGEFVYFAPDLVQDCLRSELSRLQVHTLLAQSRRAGFVPCAHPADVERLTTALSMDGVGEARRTG